MPFGIEVDQHLDLGKGAAQGTLDAFDHVMRVGDGHVARDLHMELCEVVAARAAGAEVVDAAQPVLPRGDVEKGLALVLGPFLVHQLVDRLARRLERPPAEPQRDQDAHHRIGAAHPEHLVEHHRDDDGEVEQQVALIMDVVGADRDRSGTVDDRFLVRQQCKGGDDRDHRHADAELDVLPLARRTEGGDRAPRDAGGRCGDEHHLEQRGQRLRLAMAEAVIVVGGRRGEAHAVQRYQRRQQVERGVGEAAEHRDRAGMPCREPFQPQQEQRHRHRRDGGARGERNHPLALGLGHGNSNPSDQPPSTAVKMRRSCSRWARSCQNSIVCGATR